MIYEEKKRLDFIRKWFSGLKPFESVESIPEIPNLNNPDFHRDVIVPNLVRCGAIPKAELEVGAWYEGDTRNATVARWNGNAFDHERYKFGMWFKDDVNHFEDDNGYALFVPIRKIEKPASLNLDWPDIEPDDVKASDEPTCSDCGSTD